MIETYTKSFWLKELIASGQFLEGLYRNAVWDHELEFKCEKAIFIGFYAIRKLIESQLIERSIETRNTKVTRYLPRNNVNFELEFAKKWSSAYNLLEGEKWQLSSEKICNQFIHSKVFSPFVPFRNVCVGVYISSDRDYRKFVYYIQLVTIIETFLSVAHERSLKLNVDVDENNIIRIKNIEKHT